ncbi:MAG: CHAD domain-containing protein, partial [Bacteroidetes bacterium]
MDIRQLIAFLDRLEGDVHLMLPRLFAKAGKKTVHDFRVAVKRLRAFFDLTAGAFEAYTAAEAEEALRPVYKAAGRVRKWQLIRQTLRKLEQKHDLDDRWSERAAKEVAHAREQLQAMAEAFNVVPLREACAAARSRWLHAEPEALSHRLDHYWDARLQRLHGWYQVHSQDEKAWHEARRDLKTLIYQLEALHVA